LRNIIERTILLLPAEVRVLQAEHIPLGNSTQAGCSRPNGLLTSLPILDFELDRGLDYHRVTEDIINEHKRRIIDRALELTGGNKTKAAKALLLGRCSLLREIEKIKRWQEKRDG
jgi:transcriptional regulator with PAS, ATPase and Fis domain